jgi:hypothetical protein
MNMMDHPRQEQVQGSAPESDESPSFESFDYVPMSFPKSSASSSSSSGVRDERERERERERELLALESIEECGTLSVDYESCSQFMDKHNSVSFMAHSLTGGTSTGSIGKSIDGHALLNLGVFMDVTELGNVNLQTRQFSKFLSACFDDIR